MKVNQEAISRITKDLTDRGKLIEAGWVGMRMAAIPPDAPPEQIIEMRKAFFAGAQHLFASILAILDPEKEATEALRRMDLIHKELEEFIKDFKTHLKG